MLLFAVGELKELGRGRGITLMGLDADEKMTAVGFANANSVTVTGKSRSGREKTVRVSGGICRSTSFAAPARCLLPGRLAPIAIKE
jgi:hypothetical protein